MEGQDIFTDSAYTPRTLKISDVSDFDLTEELKDKVAKYTKVHGSGWTITGTVHIRSYSWVDQVDATHSVHGWLKGDFGHTVQASSEKAYRDFSQHHTPIVREYGGPDWKVRK